MDAVKFGTFNEFDAKYDIKVLVSLGELAPVDILSWDLARSCEIASVITYLYSLVPYGILK